VTKLLSPSILLRTHYGSVHNIIWEQSDNIYIAILTCKMLILTATESTTHISATVTVQWGYIIYIVWCSYRYIIYTWFSNTFFLLLHNMSTTVRLCENTKSVCAVCNIYICISICTIQYTQRGESINRGCTFCLSIISGTGNRHTVYKRGSFIVRVRVGTYTAMCIYVYI